MHTFSKLKCPRLQLEAARRCTVAIVRMVSIFPQLDKEAEARAILERSTRGTEGRSLSQDILGEIPVLVTSTLFDTLEDFDKDRTDPSKQEGRAKLTAMSRRPVTIRLLNPIVMPLQPLDSTLRYYQQVVTFPSAEGVDDIKKVAEEFAKDQQMNGRSNFRVAQVLFPHDAPAIVLADSYETLAELENVNRQRAEAASAFRSKVGPSVTRSSITRIREILVPSEG